MANYEMNEGQGVLFHNNYKDNDKKPDYKGRILVGGKEYEMAAWVRTSQSGTKFLSLKAELPRNQAPAQPAAPAPEPPVPAPVDYAEEPDLPF